MATISRQLLMRKKKGDLEHVWMAAHFPKRIKKGIVEETNIGSSVDKILVEELPVVTYRILGLLLLGVVRIYSKKVEYLLVDCNHSLNEMKFFAEGRKKADINYGGTCLPESSSQRSQLKVVDFNSSKKNSYTFIESMRTQFSSLSLPDNFDLDAYDLEIVEDESSNDHVRPHLELVLNDACGSHRSVCHTFGKDHASASTSAMITNINPETSVEKLRHRFVLEERLDPMLLGESDDELVLHSVPLLEQEPEWNTNNNTDSTNLMSEGVKNPDKHPDEECTATGQTVVSEMASIDNILLKPSPNRSQLSVTINETPQSKAPVVSGEHKSELVAVRTPASREHVRVPRKRKCAYDYAVVIPNEVYGNWILNAGDLVRKRRTCTDVLDCKERLSFDYFMQPQIPIDTVFRSELRSVISANEKVMAEEIEETAGPTLINVQKVSGETETQLIVHQVSGETEAEVIAPLTPVNQSTALRFNEVHETSMVQQMRPTTSSESGERSQRTMFPIRVVDLENIHSEEGPSSLGEDNQENVLVAEKLSAVTKSVGGYLYSRFLHRKEKGEEDVVYLSQILKQKNKKESARFFYQMLVLKTGGYIDVKQEKPYDEICVKQTQKLKEAFGGGSRE